MIDIIVIRCYKNDTAFRLLATRKDIREENYTSCLVQKTDYHTAGSFLESLTRARTSSDWLRLVAPRLCQNLRGRACSAAAAWGTRSIARATRTAPTRQKDREKRVGWDWAQLRARSNASTLLENMTQL